MIPSAESSRGAQATPKLEYGFSGSSALWARLGLSRGRTAGDLLQGAACPKTHRVKDTDGTKAFSSRSNGTPSRAISTPASAAVRKSSTSPRAPSTSLNSPSLVVPSCAAKPRPVRRQHELRRHGVPDPFRGATAPRRALSRVGQGPGIPPGGAPKGQRGEDHGGSRARPARLAGGAHLGRRPQAGEGPEEAPRGVHALPGLPGEA